MDFTRHHEEQTVTMQRPMTARRSKSRRTMQHHKLVFGAMLTFFWFFG